VVWSNIQATLYTCSLESTSPDLDLIWGNYLGGGCNSPDGVTKEGWVEAVAGADLEGSALSLLRYTHSTPRTGTGAYALGIAYCVLPHSFVASRIAHTPLHIAEMAMGHTFSYSYSVHTGGIPSPPNTLLTSLGALRGQTGRCAGECAAGEAAHWLSSRLSL
jgi:hypothetical protein